MQMCEQNQVLIRDHIQQSYLNEVEKDVTLVCDDSILEVHKVILTAFSSVFRDVFSATDSDDIFLPGVRYDDLNLLLQFLYLGEVSVNKDQAEKMLEIGRFLDIKQLEQFKDFEKTHEELMQETIQQETSVEDIAEEIFSDSSTVLEEDVLNTKEFENSFSMKQQKDSLEEKIPGKTCPDCGKTFITGQSLNTHYNSVHRGIKLTCKFCHANYTSKQNLKKHIERKHDGTEEFFEDQFIEDLEKVDVVTCQMCGSLFSDIQSMQNHFAAAHLADKFPCKFCEKKYNTLEFLKDHLINIHKNEPGIGSMVSGFDDKYTCQFCKEEFNTKSNLTYHIKSSHNQQPEVLSMNTVEKKPQMFPCPGCDKKFSLKHNMKQHHKVVHEQKRYICTDCNIEYKAAQNLRNHIKHKH